MDLRFTPEQEHFRAKARDWLATELAGPFAEVRGRGGPGDEDEFLEPRRAWERHMAQAGWTCLDWPVQHGGRDLPLIEQVIFHEEYAKARGPGRLGHIGETLLGPTLIHFGGESQKARHLPGIRSAETLWCQGYSEPEAGSDLANVQCKALRDGDDWVITGQKTWTSLAHLSDWCFALCRTDSSLPKHVPKHKGISYLLVPMNQPGIEIRAIEQITGGAEFCEVFFDGARTHVDNIIGPVNGGWRVAMGTLAFERGASTLAQQMAFANEFEAVVQAAKLTGINQDPRVRDRLADMAIRLRVMRLNALRTLTATQGGTLRREALITKLYWANWHRDLGELAVDVLGAAAEELGDGDYDLNPLQRLFLWSRCDTIYAGSNEIQRNIIGERALGLPREPR
jgi:alkylation response protein AidB-like acyl-CoA dehydrogenase